MAAYSQYKNLELPVSPEYYNIEVFNKNARVIDSELHKIDLKNESQDNLLATKESLNSEVSRATSVENELSNDLANETNRAITSETSINDNLLALILELTTRLNALADSDDSTLDQLSEIVAYIKSNKSLIDVITTSKVDKVPGKELSTNDYTTAEKNKLKDISPNAQVNVQADWNVTDETNDAFIKNKPAIPTKTSELENDSGFGSVTAETLPVLNSAPTYNTLADFWTSFNDLVKKSNVYTAIMRFKSGNWAPSTAWYRAIVSCQNLLGNGAYDVTGQILLMDGSNVYSGKVIGGKTNTSDLTVTWNAITGISGVTYSDSEPAGLTTGTTWIGN